MSPIPDREDGNAALDRGPWITSTELRAALDEVAARLGEPFELHKSGNATGNLVVAAAGSETPIAGSIDLGSAEVDFWES